MNLPSIISIILFFVMMYCYGFSISFFVKKTEDFFENFFMNIAFGIASYTVIAAILTILKIPLLWYVFFILSLIIPFYFIIKNKTRLKSRMSGFISGFKITKSQIYFLIVLILFAITLTMYLKGAFAYSLYEDGDPWRHSGIVKYISLQKTALEPWQGANMLQYVDSYPPGYDLLFSLMYQISGQLIWTLKFFNVLLISLGIIFFYFFAKKFTGNRNTALFSTFVLAIIPCYMSHFIWALTLAVVLIYPLFYSFEHIKEDKKWMYISAICYAAVLLSQPTHAAKISILIAIYIIVKSILSKTIQWNAFFASVYGFILSMLWWVPMYFKYGSIKALIAGAGTAYGGGVTKGVTGFTLKFHGTADRIYTFNDFFVAKPENMINNPIGVGIVLMMLLFITLAYIIWKYKRLLNEENHWVIITGCMLLFTFLGIQGERLPVQFWAFRFWMLFAIFFSLFVAYGFFGILKAAKKFSIPAVIIIILFVAGVWYTSGIQKWTVNTVSWENTAGEFAQYGNLDSWKWISELPKDTKVFFPCRNVKNMDVAILGMDKYTCLWCKDEKEFKMTFANHTGEEMINFAKSKNYDYLFIDGNCLGEYNKNVTLLNNLLVNISSQVNMVQKSDGGFVWKI